MKIIHKLRCIISSVALFLVAGAWALTSHLVPERGDLFTFHHDGKAAGYNFIQYGPLRHPRTGKFIRDADGNEIWGKIPSGLPPIDGRSCRLIFKDTHRHTHLPATDSTPYHAMLSRSEVTPMPPTPGLGKLYSHRYTLNGSSHVQSIECHLAESAPLDFFQILAKFGQLQSQANAINIQRGAWEAWEEQAQTGNFENVVRAYLDRMFGQGEADARHIHDGARNNDSAPLPETVHGIIPRLPSVPR